MTQFLAILKDSFREAVDGFVIYAMLGLSALAVLVVGSMSFTPAPPQEAFQGVTGRFNVLLTDRGRGAFGSSTTSSAYAVSDVAAAAGGGHTFRLTVTAQPGDRTLRDGKEVPPAGDSFRAAVAQWSGAAGQVISVDVGGKDGPASKRGGKRGRFDVAAPSQFTPEELRAVTTEQMEAFLAGQFDTHGGMGATARRVAGVAEPTYAFDVAVAGGSGVRGWPHTVRIFFGAVTVSRQAALGGVLYIIEDRVINGVGAALALLVSVIITAFFVPNMLRKGSLDLLVSKPIGRTPLLLYKYVGGLTFIFLVTAVTVGGVWLVLALRSGFWDPTFLVLIPVLTFTFAILYSVSVLFAVLTRSPIVAMLGTIGCMFLLWLAGWGKRFVEITRVEDDGDGMPGWLVTIINAANTVLPRYKDLDTITSKLIADGTLTPFETRTMDAIGLLSYPDWGVTVGTSLAFIAVMLALACWRFQRRDS